MSAQPAPDLPPPKYGDYPELFWDLKPDEPIDVEHPAVLGRILTGARIETIRALVPFEMIERNLTRVEMPDHARRFWAGVVQHRRRRLAGGEEAAER